MVLLQHLRQTPLSPLLLQPTGAAARERANLRRGRLRPDGTHFAGSGSTPRQGWRYRHRPTTRHLRAPRLHCHTTQRRRRSRRDEGGGFTFTDPAPALHGLGPPRPSGFGAIAGGPPGGGDPLAPWARPARAVAITGPRLPASTGIIGPALSTMDGVGNQYYNCPICQAPPPGDGILQHRAFECPAVYVRQLGEPCPGFDSAGPMIPAAWTGPNITSATAVLWKEYIAKHNLPRSRMVTLNGSAFPSAAEPPPAARTTATNGRGGRLQ